VHQVGDQPRLYYDARSTNHQEYGMLGKWMFGIGWNWLMVISSGGSRYECRKIATAVLYCWLLVSAYVAVFW